MKQINLSHFRSFLNEAADKDHLDVSIPAVAKVLTSAAKIEAFLNATVTVTHKTDGVKLTVVKAADDGKLSDWVFAYKGNVLYSTEFDYQPDTKVKTEAIGASQFKRVFQHFAKLGKTAVPVGTELFIEFLMSKPTLSSNYDKKHGMVLIGTSKSNWTEKFGKLVTKNSGMRYDQRDAYAKALKIDVPQVLFVGSFASAASIERGIQHNGLKAEFNARKNSMHFDNPEILLDDIREMLLAVESKYGGMEEGVVIDYNGQLMKFQQEYQLDQEARAAIKQRYRNDDPIIETNYWAAVTRVALELSTSITVGSRKLDDLLAELSLAMKRLVPSDVGIAHSKKTVAQIKDDIQLTAKTQLIKKMKGNNNALVIGKFRILTKDGHTKMIKRAQRLYDNVVICLVTSADTKETKTLRQKMLEKTFPGITIIHSSNGNLSRVLQASPVNINAVYAGSDRVAGYAQQLKNTVGVSVKEMPRSDSDISASKVIANINDEKFFTSNTPKEIHGMYSELLRTYGKE